MIGLIWFNSIAVFGQNGTYVVDTTQSKIAFKVSHMGPFKVKGSFSDYSGSMEFESGQFKVLNAEVSFSSVDTGNDERDEILLTEPYFDVEKYPLITYRADNLARTDNGLILHGRLTIKGVEKYVSIEVEQDYDPENEIITIDGETEISRKNFELKFGSMNGLIGNKVNIAIQIVARQQ